MWQLDKIYMDYLLTTWKGPDKPIIKYGNESANKNASPLIKLTT
jgi:hypothetical protein